MAGKLAQGTWNIALFDSASGGKIHSIDSKIRVTDCVWMPDATTVAFSGATGQGKKTADGRYPDFGHIQLYKLTANS